MWIWRNIWKKGSNFLLSLQFFAYSNCRRTWRYKFFSYGAVYSYVNWHKNTLHMSLNICISFRDWICNESGVKTIWVLKVYYVCSSVWIYDTERALLNASIGNNIKKIHFVDLVFMEISCSIKYCKKYFAMKCCT